jgi:hypothetical protein
MGAGAGRTHAFILVFSLAIVKVAVFMAKRIMVMVVGAGMGTLAGLLVSVLGAGNPALIVGAIVGAVLPLLVLGPPGR